MAAFGRTALITALWSMAGEFVAATASAQIDAAADDEIIVRGRGYGEFRLEVERAENVVFARFNDINSDDRFDIHCRAEPKVGSKLYERVCSSNSWREQDANFGYDFVRELLGETGANPQRHRIEQLQMQRRLEEEMRRLTLQDPELGEAVAELGRAMQAMAAATGSQKGWTLFREIPVGTDGLPFGAARMFEVRIGNAPWSHALTGSTFTIGQLSGVIRGLEIDCAENATQLKYEEDVEWTVPTDWSACTLRVRARRGATFVLYEFER